MLKNTEFERARAAPNAIFFRSQTNDAAPAEFELADEARYGLIFFSQAPVARHGPSGFVSLTLNYSVLPPIRSMSILLGASC